MIKCANCVDDALYTYKISEELSINYCNSHLPNFLTSRKASGQINLVVPAIVEEEPKDSKKKTTEPVVEEVPEEEPVAE
jgi:hypothetical protein